MHVFFEIGHLVSRLKEVVGLGVGAGANILMHLAVSMII